MAWETTYFRYVLQCRSPPACRSQTFLILNIFWSNKMSIAAVKVEFLAGSTDFSRAGLISPHISLQLAPRTVLLRPCPNRTLRVGWVSPCHLILKSAVVWTNGFWLKTRKAGHLFSTLGCFLPRGIVALVVALTASTQVTLVILVKGTNNRRSLLVALVAELTTRTIRNGLHQLNC